MQTSREELFCEANVWKVIGKLAIPSMISIIVMIFYNMADMYFVGLLGDTAQIAAVSVVNPVFTLMMAVGTMIGGGGCVLIAKTLGEKDIDSVKRYSSLCCWGSVAFGIILAAGILLLENPLLEFIGANDDVRGYAKTYLTVLALGSSVMIFATSFGNVVRGVGAIKESLIGHLLGTVTNMILDPVFILVLGMGVGGAAVATVAGNVAASAYFILYAQKPSVNLTVNPVYAYKRPWEIGKILAIGMPNMINSTLAGFAGAFSNRLLVKYGTVTVAAMGAAGKSTMVISMIQMGICMGVQPLLAYTYGEKNLPRLKEILIKLSALTIAIGLSVTLFCLFNSRAVIALFLKEDMGAIALGQEMVTLLVLSGPFLGLFYISSNFLQAAGNALLATFVSMLRQGILLIPLLYVMNTFFAVRGNIAAHVAADMAAAVVGVILALRQYRILKKTV